MGELSGALYGVETLVEGAVALAKGLYDPTLPLKASLKSINDLNLPRAYHTISVIRGRAYVFGGKEVDENGNEKLADNSMHVVILPSSGIETTDYQKISPTLTSPSPRYGHSASVIDDQIYVFGGISDLSSEDPIDESGRVWVFDTKSLSWSTLDPLQSKDIPSARACHASTTTDQPRTEQKSTFEGTAPQLDPDPAKHVPEPDTASTYGTLIIYGGITRTNNKPSSDLWSFNIKARTWSPLPPPPLTSNTSPSPSIAMVENRLYINSGSETHSLDLSLHNTPTSGLKDLHLSPVPHPWTPISSLPTTIGNSTPGSPHTNSALIPITTGQGRNYLLLLGAASSGSVWVLQLAPEGMTAASWKDAARKAIHKDTAEAVWAETRYYDAEGVMVQEGQTGRGIGRRRGFAASKGAEGDGGAVVVWGGVGADGKFLGDGVVVSVEM